MKIEDRKLVKNSQLFTTNLVTQLSNQPLTNTINQSALLSTCRPIKTTSSKDFQFTIYNGPTNALVFIKTLIQMSQTKTLKITPTCFDHQMIIIRELSDPG
jgi:hypothetical protein